METHFKRTGWIAMKSWLLALFINTIGGTYIVTGIGPKAFSTALQGLAYGACFSFPVFILIWLVIYVLIIMKLNFINTFLLSLLCGVGMSIGSFFCFSIYKQLNSTLNIPLAGMVLAASVTGIASQISAIQKLLYRRDHPDFFKHNKKQEAEIL